MTGPNFLIAGAPKCGTSTLYHWLRARPDIYLPHASGDAYWRHKEPCFFCPDIVEGPSRVESEEYDAIFAPGAEYSLRGEATPFYLISDVAADLIYEANPSTKIILCLRHPAEFILSQWRDSLYWGHDEELNFEKAIDPDRPLADLPARCWYPKACRYRHVAEFSTYLSRFTNRFPAHQIHYVWLKDMKTDPERCFADVLSFLGAAPVEGKADLSAHN
ncbi:MAG: sulfotransferase domain-containing protein, partial [Pseudomonadota bacterium]